MSHPLKTRQTFLIDGNIDCLRQLEALLGAISDREYTAAPAALPDQQAGGHVRHVLEFYECLLDGLETAHIDYDARKRDPMVATCREVALSRIRRVIAGLEQERALRSDFTVWVRAEGAGAAGLHDGYLTSSVGRELQTLSSHSVHHFALIGFVLRLNGVDVPADFGVAPSTLLYRASLAAEAA